MAEPASVGCTQSLQKLMNQPVLFVLNLYRNGWVGQCWLYPVFTEMAGLASVGCGCNGHYFYESLLVCLIGK